MGFLDNVKKGLNDAAKGLSDAVNTASSPSSSSAPAPPSGTIAPGVDPDFIDGLNPQTWLPSVGSSLDEVFANDAAFFADGGAAGPAPTFGEPQVFEVDDAVVARYVSTDGSTTVDLASIKESVLSELGTQDGLCTSYKLRLAARHDDHDGIGERGIEGSNGPGHAQVLVCLGDMAARCDLYGDASLDVDRALVTCHNILYLAMRES